MTTRSCLVLVFLGGCGQGSHGGAAADAPPPPIDVATCARPGYPEIVKPVEVALGAPVHLTLDGIGAVCDQMIRAITDPATRPPELAGLDPSGATGTCTHDPLTNLDRVRIHAPRYDGLPALWGQDLDGHVDGQHDLVNLSGSFLPLGHAPPAGCLDGSATADALIGQPLPYQRFASCAPQGPGSRTLAVDDYYFVRDEGVYLDAAGRLRRVRAVDVYLAPWHVDAEVLSSDAGCPANGRAGKLMYVDVLTGEVVATFAYCIVC
jgi:hypothetical protein